MTLSREMEALYEQNRLKKAENATSRKRCFWAHVILAAALFGTSFIAGALSSTNGNYHGSMIFYASLAAGILQILLSIVTLFVGWMNYREVRIPSLLYLGICTLLLIYMITHLYETFSTMNILFLMIGIALNIWAQMIFHTEEALKEQPGYPLFSPEASFAAHYELPKDVLAAKQTASTHMAEISTPAPAPEAAVPAASVLTDPHAVRMPDEVRLPEVRASDFGLDAELGAASKPLPVPEITGDVTLEGFAQAAGGVTEKGVDALPKVSAEDLLMDMTAVPSHATVKGDVSQLPDPAEVRARMAAMKKAREEHPLT